MNEREERRSYRRLDITLPIECLPVESDGEAVCRGVARSVGSGGLYFETETDAFKPGTTWKLALTVPPGEGHFPYAGQVKGVAEILRVENLAGTASDNRRFGVAARFSEHLELRFQDP